MERKGTSYNSIFKTTFVFGFVQVFQTIIAVVKNKLVAILIGVEGMGIYGIFSSTIQMIQTGAGLGINQSAVRDVSAAKASEDRNKLSKIISVTNRIILLTGLLGLLITLVLSKFLSVKTLGNTSYIVSYCFLGFAVLFNIINEGKLSILKGMRQLKALATASVMGSIVGLVVSIPLYYFFGKNGIVHVIVICSFSAVCVSQYFIKKMPIDKMSIPLSEVIREGKPMVKIGFALMFVTFLQTIVALVLNSFIRSKGGVEDVGFFCAGGTILSSYFGVVITALMTDYYPRIAAVRDENEKLQDELNKQAKVSYILCSPLFVIFMVYLPIFIRILYTEDFLPAIDYIKFGIYWTLITVCSNEVDMILVAKGNVSFFTVISICIRAIQLGLCVFLYSAFSLSGLGIAYATLGVVHLVVMVTVVYKLYKIRFDKDFVKLFIWVLLMALASTFAAELNNSILRYSLGIMLVIFSVVFSFVYSKRFLDLDIIAVVESKFFKK